MARLNKKAELWSYLSQVGVFRDNTGIGNTTLSAAAAAGATTISLVGNTGFAAGNWCRIGGAIPAGSLAGGETMEINQQVGALTGAGPFVMTTLYPVAIAHAAGEAVVGQTLTDLGHATDTGVKVDIKGDHNVVKSAVRRLALGYLIGHIEIEASWELIGYALENVATTLAMKESDITGAGSAGNPNRLYADPNLYSEENDLSFFFRGFRKDTTPVYGFLWGCEVDVTAIAMQMQRGKEAPIQFRVRATSGYAISFGL